MDNTLEPGKRIYYLDAARAIAIISVTMNHAVNRSFDTSKNTLQEFLQLPFWLTLIKAVIYIFSRLGVPLFLMITGALLLDRDYSDRNVLRKHFRHNWLSILITTQIWLCIMFWQLNLGYIKTLIHDPFNLLGQFLMNQLFLNQTTMGSMWYMPMILLIYPVIPIIAVGLKQLDKRLYVFLFIMVFISSMLIPNINTALLAMGKTFQFKFELNYVYVFSRYWLFILAGYAINKGVLSCFKTWTLSMFMVISFVATVAFQIWIYSSPLNYAVTYQDSGTLIASSALFEMLRRTYKKSGNAVTALQKATVRLSAISFGNYFVHMCIMTYMNDAVSTSVVNYLPRFIMLETVSFAGAVLIIELLSRIRFCRKYMFLIKT